MDISTYKVQYLHIKLDTMNEKALAKLIWVLYMICFDKNEVL